MILKFISLATAVVTLDVYLQSRFSSSDPLFLFASSNHIINACLVVIAASAVFVSFKRRFKYWVSYIACTIGAVVFGGLGLAGTLFSDKIYSFPGFLLPIDYLVLLEAGVVFAICSLSYDHQKLPALPKFRSLAQLNKTFDLPVFKIPHSPSNITRSSTIETQVRL